MTECLLAEASQGKGRCPGCHLSRGAGNIAGQVPLYLSKKYPPNKTGYGKRDVWFKCTYLPSLGRKRGPFLPDYSVLTMVPLLQNK